MPRFVALYRGVNVGGKNAVRMVALRGLHERLGHKQAQTYIQSGNVVFDGRGSASTIARRIAAEFAEEFGFDARPVVVPAEEWAGIVAQNPYADFAAQDPKSVHVAFAAGRPSGDGLAALLKKTGGRETFAIEGRVVYLHAPDGLGTSKFAAGMERAAGVPLTARNWRTALAISQLLADT